MYSSISAWLRTCDINSTAAATVLRVRLRKHSSRHADGKGAEETKGGGVMSGLEKAPLKLSATGRQPACPQPYGYIHIYV